MKSPKEREVTKNMIRLRVGVWKHESEANKTLFGLKGKPVRFVLTARLTCCSALPFVSTTYLAKNLVIFYFITFHKLILFYNYITILVVFICLGIYGVCRMYARS